MLSWYRIICASLMQSRNTQWSVQAGSSNSQDRSGSLKTWTCSVKDAKPHRGSEAYRTATATWRCVQRGGKAEITQQQTCCPNAEAKEPHSAVHLTVLRQQPPSLLLCIVNISFNQTRRGRVMVWGDWVAIIKHQKYRNLVPNWCLFAIKYVCCP